MTATTLLPQSRINRSLLDIIGVSESVRAVHEALQSLPVVRRGNGGNPNRITSYYSLIDIYMRFHPGGTEEELEAMLNEHHGQQLLDAANRDIEAANEKDSRKSTALAHNFMLDAIENGFNDKERASFAETYQTYRRSKGNKSRRRNALKAIYRMYGVADPAVKQTIANTLTSRYKKINA